MTTRPECPLVRERLPALLENGLPPGETLLVRAHVEGCAGCRTELDAYSTLVDDVVATGDAAGFEAARAALADALDEAPREAGGVVARLAPRAKLLAAAAAVLAVVGAVLLEPPAPTFAELRLASRALASPIDAVRPVFRLPDLGNESAVPGDSR